MNRVVRNSVVVCFLSLFCGPLAAQSSSGTEQNTTLSTEKRTSDQDNITIAHGIGVFGEPALPADFRHLPYVNPEAPKGGEIAVSMPGGFDNYNPFTVRGRPEILSSLMLESMMTGTMDEVGTAYCLICKTIEYPESRDWVIFNLRPEVKFSDGTPLTADDVMFSYETLRDKELSSYRSVLAQSVAGAEVLDDRRIRFDFIPGYPRRDVIQTAAGLPVFSKKEFSETGRDLENSSNTPFLGSGPYMFARADPGRTSVYRRNPDYWGKDLPINIGRFNFDRIRAEYFADSEAAFEAFKSGEYTVRYENTASQWATGYDFPNLESGYVIKKQIHNGNKAPAQGFFINMRRAKFQDQRVREAIGLMFSFEWANKALFYEQYSRTQSFWENSDLKAEGKPSADELALLKPLAADLPEGILTENAVLPPVGDGNPLDRKNFRKAAKLLDAAGWVTGNDGMRRNKAGQLLTVRFMNNSQSFDRVIGPFVHNLRALGIDAMIEKVDGSEYQTRLYQFDYDIIVAHALTDMIASDGLYQIFGSQSTDDVFNPAGISNPAVDKLIDAAVAAKDYDAMRTAVHALDRVLRAIHPWIPNWYSPNINLAYYDQYEYPEALPPYLTTSLNAPWYFDFWWYNAGKAEKLKKAGILN